ncbi:MAG: diguanylate cyclase, partial [Burkholderia sp.]|nr:diguanylate cyclase [Burkholderia sp.]
MVTRRPNLIIAISGVLASAILALAVWVLAQMHDDALRRAQDSVFNVSLLVERDVSRNLEIYDLSIRTVIDGLKQSRVMQLDPALRQMVLFDGMNLGAGGSMALMLSDGTMLMRRPYDPKTIGINLMGTANYSRFVQQPSGDFFGTAAIDGVERWYAFRHIDMYPLILDVALSTRDIYVGWRRRAWIIGSLIGALNLTMIA